MNITQTLDTLRYLPVHISVLLKGNHGIGKSQIIRQLAKELDIPCVDFRLSQNDVGDLKGMPFRVGLRTVFAPPEFMPLTASDEEELKKLLNITEEISAGRYGDKGILFLDEINRANREVQQAAFELVLDRRMNLRPLPEGWRVVSAINADSDIYTVNEMETAFLSRFFTIDFNPSYEEWLSWARENKLHEAVVQFIIKYPDFLDPTKEFLEESARQGVKEVHDRRAWHMFSDSLIEREMHHDAGRITKGPLDKSPENIDWLHQFGNGFVGHMAATKFRSFVETDYQSLDANRILNKWDEEVEKHLKGVVKRGKILELGSYNELILDYIKTKVKSKLDAKQKVNLSQYLKIIPNEVVADFWQKLNQDHKIISEDWYASSTDNSKIILGSLVNPDAKKKAAEIK